jgi:lauroyl/myristoyl acyltransferase
MDTLLYHVARALLSCMQALPLSWVAQIGRACGTIAYALDARHRRRALANLTTCFPDWTAEHVRAIARENFRRIGENFACAAKTAGFSAMQVREVLEIDGMAKLALNKDRSPRSVVVAIGHFGNFELFVRANLYAAGYQIATTYRGLRQPGLNHLLQALREKSGCLFFERRTDAAALKAAMARPGLLLGLLADQHAGDRGVRLPFLGHDCSTSVAPAIFALRYGCPLYTAICYRLAPGRWRIEVGDEIPTHTDGQPRAIEAISLDVNRTFEAAVRRDPANWFWVHNRWKQGKWRTTVRMDQRESNP